MTKTLLILFFFVLSISANTFSLSESPTELKIYTSMFEVTPMQGRSIPFETAVRKHMKWASEGATQFDWEVFVVIYGKRAGNYLFLTREHSWKDFDAMQDTREKFMMNWQTNVSQNVQSVNASIYREIPNLSRKPSDVKDYPYAQISFFDMKPTSALQFRKHVARMAGAIKTQQDAPPAVWYQQEAGGDQGTYLTIRPFKKWEDWPNLTLAKSQSKGMDPKITRVIIEELAAILKGEETSVIMRRNDLGS